MTEDLRGIKGEDRGRYVNNSVELIKQVLILSIVWYCIARFFYLKHAKKIALNLLDDDEYVEKSNALVRNVIAHEVGEFVDSIALKIDAIKLPDINIPELVWTDDLSKHFMNMLNGWYGNLHKAVDKQMAAENGEIKTAVQYAQMNQGSPQALDMIQQALMQKSPILAMGLQLLQQGNNSNLRTPPRQGEGGY